MLVVKSPPASAEDLRDIGSTSGSGRSPVEGNGNHLQDPMDRGAWLYSLVDLHTPTLVAGNWNKAKFPPKKKKNRQNI